METEKSCKIGFAITGSFCTHEKIKEIIQDMVDDGMDTVSYTHLDRMVFAGFIYQNAFCRA